jgi:tetratricopeptide (TPR) repeat protein
MPIMGVVAWWLFSAWFTDKSLHFEEFVVGAGLWLIAFSFGVNSILHGGWGSMTVVGVVYAALLGLAVWEYLYWRRRELQHLQRELVRYQRAIEHDPTATAAYSLLGETHLKLRQYEDAEAALEKALALDPESRKDRSLLRRAQAKEGGPPKWWAD